MGGKLFDENHKRKRDDKMYQAFNLRISKSKMPFDSSDFNAYYQDGERLLESNKEKIRDDLEYYASQDGTLSAENIEKNWFHSVDAHLFLSHSHDDIREVTALAGWLNKTFGIVSFIDYWAWGFADNLLWNLDMNCCKNSNSKNDNITFDYSMRNLSTAHVHNLLLMSLAKMIDSSKCLFFVNTPSSVEFEGIFSTDKYVSTASPWIYSELMLSKLLQKPLNRVEKNVVLEHAIQMPLKIEYHPSVKHLIEINRSDLCRWNRQWQDYTRFKLLPDPADALQQLCYMKGLLNDGTYN